MFGKKKDAKQEQPTIPGKTEEPKLTNDSKRGFKKVNESRKESNMANLTSDANIKGTIKFGQTMRIDGNFEGELITDNGELIVGKTGNVKASIKVRSAVIEGRVDGNIKATDKVELKQNAHLIGDLQAKTLVVEKGVVLVGQCNVNPEGTKAESQSHSYKEESKEEAKPNRLINV
jgi:cytoskeletal protein CcmA (bactofilin family)